MKKKRLLILFISLLTLACFFIDLPKIPVNVDFHGIKYKGDIGDFSINTNILGAPIQKSISTVLGLDLKGGSELILQADMSKIPEDQRQQALDSVQTVIQNRVNQYGVSEPNIYTEHTGEVYKVVVDIAGVKDINDAKKLLGTTAKLEFWVNKIGVSDPKSFSDIQGTNLSGSDLKGAKVVFSDNSPYPQIQLNFNSKGLQKFSDIAKANVGKPVYVFLDGQLLSSPTISADFKQGAVNDPVINGSFTVDQAKILVNQLNAGALPVPVSIVAENTVSASLGGDSIKASALAGTVGVIIIVIFMIYNYGIFGLFADIALIIYALLTYALFRLIPVTLTLAGIAGFILSIGMAVDANILIFERAKEERRKGKTLKTALELGFHRAWPSIRDSNISSLITTLILYLFGSSIIRGFALTLALGIFMSLFTAVIVTRTLLTSFIGTIERFYNIKIFKKNGI